MAPKGTSRDEALWSPRAMTLNTADDWTNYLGLQEAKLNELDGRLSDAEADNKHMARDLQQLVGVRVKQKIEGAEGQQNPNDALVAAVVASANNKKTTTPTPVTFPQTGGSVHQSQTTPPTVAAGPTLAAVGMQASLDPTFPNTDESGRIILKNLGSAPFVVTSQADQNMLVITWGTPYTFPPHVDAYVEGDIAQSSNNFAFAYLLNPQNGGSKTTVTLQAIVNGSGNIPVNGSIAVRYATRATVQG